MKKIFALILTVVIVFGVLAGVTIAANDGLEDFEFTDSRGNQIVIPGGAKSCAIRVVSFTPGAPWTNDQRAMDSEKTLGVPDYDSRAGTNYLTLGAGGVIVLEFDIYIVDGPGMDIYVFEIGPDAEATSVEVSEDLVNWIYVGDARGRVSGVDMEGKVPADGKYRYVRITDLKTSPGSSWPGADIDAVAGLNVLLLTEEVLEPQSGYYHNNDYDSYVKLDADKTAELSINFGEAIFPLSGTWSAAAGTDGNTYVTINVINSLQGWSVTNIYIFLLSADRGSITLVEGEMGIAPTQTRFGYIGTALPAPTPGESSLPNNMSGWARLEVEKAYEMGLIPNSLLNPSVDYTRPITRAEFAAVSVKVYESLSGTSAIPAIINHFTDTIDVEVLKAYNVGITTGTSATTFSPNALLSREEAATMLTRVFKKVAIPNWTIQTDSQFTLQFNMPARFADDAQISDWAKDSVYFMAANNIIGGVGNNMFAPRAVTTEEQARNYASATREQALAIAVRMVENLPNIPASETVTIPLGKYTALKISEHVSLYLHRDGTFSFDDIPIQGGTPSITLSGTYTISGNIVSCLVTQVGQGGMELYGMTGGEVLRFEYEGTNLIYESNFNIESNYTTLVAEGDVFIHVDGP